MLRKRINIAIFLLIGLISIQTGYVFAEQPKGSRLNIKPVVVKKKALSFSKGKSVIGFKASEGNFDLKPANTVKLYFTNYLTNRNLSKPIIKEQQTTKPVAISEVAYNTPAKATSSSEEEAEPGERFFTVEGLTISNIYPNPADDAGNFDYSFSGNNYKEVKVDFFNVLGSPMNVSVVLEKFDRKARVSLKEFPNGFYFYQLIADGKTLATKKLLVRHYN